MADVRKTIAEGAIDKFYEYATQPMNNEEIVKDTLIAYDNVLKVFLKQTILVASHLEISNKDLQRQFEEAGSIANDVLRKAKATVLKLPLVLNHEGNKYLAVFTREEELSMNKEASKNVNCLEIKYLANAYKLLVKNEDINGIIVNPFSKAFVVDLEHLEHLSKGCPKKDLDKALRMAKEAVEEEE